MFALTLFVANIGLSQAQSMPQKAYPVGEVTLPAAKEYCFNSLERQGELGATTYIAYTLSLEKTQHYGRPIDIFVGFRMKDQPGKLWLLSNMVHAQWVEYAEGGSPVAYFDSPATLDSPYTVTILNSSPIDLSHLISHGGNDGGELLVGYGLRDETATATSADSFREMLSENRFTSAWVPGFEDVFTQICFEYSKVSVKAYSGAEPTNH